MGVTFSTLVWSLWNGTSQNQQEEDDMNYIDARRQAFAESYVHLYNTGNTIGKKENLKRLSKMMREWEDANKPRNFVQTGKDEQWVLDYYHVRLLTEHVKRFNDLNFDPPLTENQIRIYLKHIKATWEEQLETEEAKEQLALIFEENMDDIWILWRMYYNLEVISDLQHFLHSTHQIVRRSPIDPSITETNPQSGLAFYREYITIGGSLSLAPEMYNIIGKEVVQCEIYTSLINCDTSAVRKVLNIAYPKEKMAADDLEYHSPRIRDIHALHLVVDILERCFLDIEIARRELNDHIANCAKYRKEDLLRATIVAYKFASMMEKYERFEEEFSQLSTSVTMVGDYLYALANDSNRKKNGEAFNAVKTSFLDLDFLEEMAKEFSKVVGTFASGKEDLLRATIVAYTFASMMEKYERFKEEFSQLSTSVTMVGDYLYARADDSSRKRKGGAFNAVKTRFPDLDFLEEMAKEFYKVVGTFASGSLERLSFKNHVMKVRRTLSYVLNAKVPPLVFKWPRVKLSDDTIDYDRKISQPYSTLHPDNRWEPLIIAGKPIFQSMSMQDFDRLRRVFGQAKPKTIKECVALCNDPEIAKYIRTPDDFACIIELRKVKGKKQDLSITAAEIREGLSQIGDFPTKFNWHSIPSKTYHYYKHEKELRTDEEIVCQPEEYFINFSNRIFKCTEKFKGALYDQSGIPQERFFSVLEDGSVMKGFRLPRTILDPNTQVIKSQYISAKR